MAKTDWQMGDTVLPDDLNQIGQEINQNRDNLAAHTAATTGVHGATSAATPNTLVQRDPAGRFKAAAPSASDDVARKAEVDAVQSNLNSHKSATTLDHPDGSVTTAKIADSAVTEAKIANSAVTANKIASGAVTSAKIADSAVTEAKIANSAVTANKIASGAVTSAKIASGAATDTVIGNRTITDTSAPSSDSGTLTNLLSWLAYMIKAITGKSNWRTAPATTLEAAAAHIANTNNPHGVTKSQVGLGNVQNYGIASQAQAQAGTDNASYMTPLRTKQAIDQFVPIETGSWTPDLRFGGSNAGITYALRAGRYTRIANVVYWSFVISLNSKGSASGTATIAGLPFNSGTITDFFHTVGHATNIFVPSGQWLSSYNPGTAIVLATSAGSRLTNAEFSNNSTLQASGFYFIS